MEGGETYHIDLGHGVDQNYGEDRNCQSEEEGAGEVPDYTSEMEDRFLLVLSRIYLCFPRQLCSETFNNNETVSYAVS